ncbi:GNAT family N-acetyltransferase [Rubrolithibacter danxiaensis]|uniref:GNAT family N-acetyltransferase n=1 Tax=Rubrolithibacter danxiaensis TaxID=3390805 RepID=UPI003BF7C855
MEVTPLDDSQGVHFGLYENDELVSVVSLFKHGEKAWLRKFGTVEEKQYKGYGTRLLNYLINFSRSFGIKKLACNACDTAASFYRRFKFRETKRITNQDGSFIELELDLI